MAPNNLELCLDRPRQAIAWVDRDTVRSYLGPVMILLIEVNYGLDMDQ